MSRCDIKDNSCVTLFEVWYAGKLSWSKLWIPHSSDCQFLASISVSKCVRKRFIFIRCNGTQSEKMKLPKFYRKMCIYVSHIVIPYNICVHLMIIDFRFMHCDLNTVIAWSPGHYGITQQQVTVNGALNTACTRKMEA